MSNTSEAERIIKGFQGTDELSLAGLGLTSLTPLLSALSSVRGIPALDLSGNKLTELPANLGTVLPSVARLTMAGNPFSGVRAVLAGLQSMPALKDLRVDLPSETDEDQLIVALPHLERFNGTLLTEDGNEALGTGQQRHRSAPRGGTTSPRATYWTSHDSRAVEELFAHVTEASGEATHPQEFFDYLNRVVKHVTCLTAADDDPLCQEGEVLKARRLLFEYCSQEMAKHVARKDPVMGKGMAALIQHSSQLMDDYDLHWRRIFRDRDARLTLMKKDMKDAIKQIESLMTQVSGAELGAVPGAVPGARGTPLRSERALRGVRGAGGSGDNGHGAESRRVNTSVTSYGRSGSSSSGGGSPKHPDKSGSSGLRGGRPPGVESNEVNYQGKVLTLKQLKNTIEDIYSSKTKFDAKCKESGLPRETMEQHMYTYLNQRYGLREIIQDWAAAIVRGVKRFAADDNDVAVFGKVLRNDIDEEFRYVQRQVRDTVRELVRAQIKARRPLKGDHEIHQQLEKKMNGTLTEDEWGNVVRYMYNKQDAATIAALVRKHQQRRLSRVQRPGRGASPSAAAEGALLPYRDLVALLLDFQLESHERFLADYVAVFRRYDRDGNGIVNSDEFKAIVRVVDGEKSEEEVEAMANLIDPFGNRLVTFSETVTFLGDELARMSRE